MPINLKEIRTGFEETSVDELGLEHLQKFKDKTPVQQAESLEKVMAPIAKIADASLRNLYIDDFASKYKIKKGTLQEALKVAIDNLKSSEEKLRVQLSNKRKKAKTNNGPELVSFSESLETQSDDIESDFRFYYFFKQDGEYYTYTLINKQQQQQRISNFVMKSVYFIPDETDNAKRIIKFQNGDGDIQVIEVTAKQFNISSFKALLRSREGSLTFYGNQFNLDVIIDYEREYSEQVAKEMDALGYQPEGGFFALSNKIISTENEIKDYDEGGFCINEDNIWYNPTANSYTKDERSLADLKVFVYEESDISLEKWLNLLNTAYGNNALIGFAFLLVSLHRDFILKKNLQVHHLFLRGTPQSGKSSFAYMFSKILAPNRKQISLTGGSTNKGWLAELAQIRNYPTVLEEYKNSVDMEVVEILKNVADGFVKKIKAMDNKANTTLSHDVLSSLILVGQDLPSKDPALFSRCVLIDFFSIKYSKESTEAHRKLRKYLEKGLGNIVKDILKYSDDFKNRYEETYYKIYDGIKDEHSLFSERLYQNMSQLLTAYKVYGDHFSLPVKYEDFKKFLIEKMTDQHELMAVTDDVAKFWKIFNQLCNDEVKKLIPLRGLEGQASLDENSEIRVEEIIVKAATFQLYKHYKRFTFNNINVIGIKFSEVWAYYTKEHQRLYNIPGLGEDNLKGYLQASSSYVLGTDGKKTYNTNMKLYGKGGSTSVYMFSWDQLNGEYFHQMEYNKNENKIVVDTAEQQTILLNENIELQKSCVATYKDEPPF